MYRKNAPPRVDTKPVDISQQTVQTNYLVCTWTVMCVVGYDLRRDVSRSAHVSKRKERAPTFGDIPDI